MKIEFENGSKISTIDDVNEPTRGKRHTELITYIRKNPYEFAKRMGYLNNLYWYQKLWIWIICKLDKLGGK